jgi:putative heme-binding domain-containing protein
MTVAPRIRTLLKDEDVRVRRAAAILAGKLKLQESADLLLQYAADAELQLRSASLRSLNELHDQRALRLAVAALDFPECQPAALAYLAQFGGLTHRDSVAAVGRRSRSIDVLTAATSALVAWQNDLDPESADWNTLERTIAEIQSASGTPLQWRFVGSLTLSNSAALFERAIATKPLDFAWLNSAMRARTVVTSGNGGVLLPASDLQNTDSIWLATTDFLANKSEEVEFLASVDAGLNVWLNGREIFSRKKTAEPQPTSERFVGTLAEGGNRLLVRVAANSSNVRLQLRFRRRSTKAEHEQLTQRALKGGGDIDRGRALFIDAKKSLCLNCHRFGERGGKIGPDLAGVGSRFSRIHLIESVLEPSRTVAPSYETVVIALKNGRTLAGIRVSETDDMLTLGDTEGKIHEVVKGDIEERQVQSRSTMPDGLEKRLKEKDFVDLIEFLVSQKKHQQQ